MMLAAGLLQCFSQEVSAEKKSQQKQVADTNENVKVVIGQDRLVVEGTQDATNIRIGDHGVKILESLEGTGSKVEFKNYGTDEAAFDQDEQKDSPAKKRTRFKGHWAGIELGLNNYLTEDHKFELPDAIDDYMTLNSSKSRNASLNFGQLSIGLARHVGFVTGLGLSWNNYMFDSDYNIMKDTDGNIVMRDPEDLLKKSKLTTLYLKVPLVLEFQIPTDHKRLNVSAGAIGAVKLASYTVMIFEDDHKVKSDGDFNLNLLRYGATARIGYENFTLYGTYYLTPLFKTGKGPGAVDLYPFEIGIAFTID